MPDPKDPLRAPLKAKHRRTTCAKLCAPCAKHHKPEVHSYRIETRCCRCGKEGYVRQSK